MVYETYGQYVEDLEDDIDEIIRYFGVDFMIKPEKKLSPLLTFGDSYGDSRNLIRITHWISDVILERETGFGSGQIKQ